MTRDKMIPHDSQNLPLYIKTDSVVGSGEIVKVRFWNDNERLAGKVYLSFTSPPNVTLYLCQKHIISFPPDQSSTFDKILKITLTKIPDLRLVLHCNDVEVLNVLFSDETCGDTR